MCDTERGYTATLETPLSLDEFGLLTKNGRLINGRVLLNPSSGITMLITHTTIVFFELKERVNEHIQCGVNMVQSIICRVLYYTTKIAYCRRTYYHRKFSDNEMKTLAAAYDRPRRCLRIVLPCYRGRCMVFCDKMVMYCVCNDHDASIHMNKIMMDIGRVLAGGD